MEHLLQHVHHLSNCHGEVTLALGSLGTLFASLPVVRHWVRSRKAKAPCNHEHAK